jgi:hypothetical protein
MKRRVGLKYGEWGVRVRVEVGVEESATINDEFIAEEKSPCR